MESTLTYVIISPVRNEGKFIDHTLQSVVSQTFKPLKWIIVDDGSTDDTKERIKRFSSQHSFIEVLEHRPKSARAVGGPVIEAFNFGLHRISHLLGRVEFLVKLDGDLGLGSKYFECVLTRMAENKRIGIASGVPLEKSSSGNWRPVRMPPYHAAGQSKVVRTKCFLEIGGFVSAPGWDTIDEIRANSRGWITTHFHDCQYYHLKPLGSVAGPWRTSIFHGHVDYLIGAHPLMVTVKAFQRMFQKPYLKRGVGLLKGYFKALVAGESRLVTRDEMKVYRSMQIARILYRLLGNRYCNWGAGPFFFYGV